jgi:hypothetical protein
MVMINEHGGSDGSATFGKKDRKSVTLDEEVDLKKIYESKERKVGAECIAGIPESTLTNLIRPKHAMSVIKTLNQNVTVWHSLRSQPPRHYKSCISETEKKQSWMELQEN